MSTIWRWDSGSFYPQSHLAGPYFHLDRILVLKHEWMFSSVAPQTWVTLGFTKLSYLQGRLSHVYFLVSGSAFLILLWSIFICVPSMCIGQCLLYWAIRSGSLTLCLPMNQPTGRMCSSAGIICHSCRLPRS